MHGQVGVVGGGTMGKGLIRHFLTRGLSVTLVEATADLAEKTRRDVLHAFESAVKAGKLAAEIPSQRMDRLVAGAEISSLGDCGFVIETVPEDLELKRRILTSIEQNIGPDAIIGSNTSALPITALAAGLTSPGRFAGTHFFNPPHVMPLVEVVSGADSAPGPLQRLMDFLSGTGKRPILVKDCPGFLVNRILGAYMNEALRLLGQDAGIMDLDEAAEAMGFPMGPAKLGDMVGWDVIYASNRTLETSYGERFAIPRLLVQLNEDKRLGAKTGKGLLDHTTAPPTPTADLAPAGKSLGADAVDLLQKRLMYAIIAEALRCLDEVVASAGDIDEAMILGGGFPRGPLAWADDIGCGQVLSDLELFSKRYGAQFRPAPVLRISVPAGRRLSPGRTKCSMA
ncbi:MAG: 3-hydroxyacyl-CoA dehydrogenase NAD-binding domain-containing protein [Pseudomonadota bacterium]